MQVTVELSYFIIRGVTNNFEVIAVLLDMCLIKGTTAGQNIVAGDVKKVFARFKIHTKKLSSITNDGATAMTGKIKKVLQNFLWMNWKLKKRDLVVNHFIIYQEKP